jgi:hypothetical protein
LNAVETPHAASGLRPPSNARNAGLSTLVLLVVDAAASAALPRIVVV